MLVEISKIRNLNSDYTLELIISLKQSINRELLDIIDKYLQINDQKDIKIKVSRKDDMSIIGNKEDDELPFVKRYKIEDKDLPF